MSVWSWIFVSWLYKSRKRQQNGRPQQSAKQHRKLRWTQIPRKGSQFLSETFIINSLLNEKDLLPHIAPTIYGPLYVINNVASSDLPRHDILVKGSKSDINQIGFPFSYTTCTANQTYGILVCPLLITGINKHRGLCCFNN